MNWESYATRSCRACEDGTRYTTPSDPGSKPELVTCSECGGCGECQTFVYPRPKSWRGKWPPESRIQGQIRSQDTRGSDSSGEQ